MYVVSRPPCVRVCVYGGGGTLPLSPWGRLCREGGLSESEVGREAERGQCTERGVGKERQVRGER